jgi:cytochrome c biogenesis protein ResB
MVWLWRFLTSRNTALVLLITVSLVLLISAILPNPALMYPDDAERLRQNSPFLFWLGENFNSMKVGSSKAFGVIGILLVISTTFCSIDRIIKRLSARETKILKPPSEWRSINVRFEVPPQEIQKGLVSILKRNRWRIRVYDSGSNKVITASKGEIGFWGSIFFHAILITLIAGLVFYFFSGFYATMVLTEGQELMLSKENLSRIDRLPLFGLRLPHLLFKFNSFSAKYYDERIALDYSADFDIVDLKSGKRWRQVLRVNEPFRYKNIDFLMILQGYSPNFILFKNGTPVFDSFVALNFNQDYMDSFEIEREGMYITAQFFPDMVRREDGSVYTKSLRPENPYFGLDILKNGKRVFRGLIGIGEGATFGEYRIVFNDLRHWITLNLVRETGIGFFFLCSMVGLMGLLIRVIDPERKIFVDIKDTTVEFYSYSKHFEGLLNEGITRIIDELKTQIGGT